MIPAAFEYHRPDTIEAAIDLLRRYGEDAKILSGGHSLIPALKLRLSTPAAVVDISRIPGLGEIRRPASGNPGSLEIGAMVTHHQVETDPLILKFCPLLARTAPMIGDVQVRNRGTVAGSICHADPAADWPAALLALDAQIAIAGPEGEKTMRLNDFLEGMLTTQLKNDEIVRAIIIPRSFSDRCAYRKVHQSASGFAIVGVAVQLEMKGSVCEEIAIGITGIAQRAFRARTLEKMLRGKPLEEAQIARAARLITDEVSEFLSDIHASAVYRAGLAQVQVQRAIQAARS